MVVVPSSLATTSMGSEEQAAYSCIAYSQAQRACTSATGLFTSITAKLDVFLHIVNTSVNNGNLYMFDNA